MSSLALATLRYLLVASALAGAYYSAIFARASFLFGQDTAASVPAAVDLVPYNASYLARLAAWQSGKKEALLQRAVRLNPFDFASYIQLGLAAEMQAHDLAAAERYYLEAAHVNHMFLPKWTLANFYFRREQPDKFFRWAKAALQVSPYQADPVFTQMWLISQDPQRIAAAVPDKVPVLLQYTLFLTRTGQFASIPPVVERLVALTGARNPSDRNPADLGRDDQILPEEDRILAAGQLQPALEIWRTMAAAHWIGHSVPTPAAPLTNGDFASPLLHHGFDWVSSTNEGVTTEQLTGEKNLRITLSGDEPEHCVLLQQYVPLDRERSYRLQWQAAAQGIEEPSGISWQVHPVGAGTLAGSAAEEVLKGSSGIWDFQSSPTTDISLLTLEYSRPLGKLRANGSLTLRSVSLQEK